MKTIYEEIEEELRRARTIHPHKFNSSHEGFAVLWEEVDELWAEVRKPRHARNLTNMRSEAIQIGAMAVRFIQDLLSEK